MYLSVNGRRTYYISLGEGWPVLFLHGWGTDSSVYFSFAKQVAVLGCQVFIPDMPGFGRSEGPHDEEAWGVNDYSAFVSTFAKKLEINRATVVGHSFGGRVAIVLAASNEPWVANLVLIAAAGIRPRRNLRYHARRLIALTARKLLGWCPKNIREQALQRTYAWLSMTDYARAGHLRATFVRVVNEDLTEYLKEISIPTLLIWGRNDTEVPVRAGEEMASHISDSRLEILDAAHYPFVEAPTQCVNLMKEVLSGHRSPC